MTGKPRRRADVVLVERGLFDSRARARAAIEAGLVRADGVVLARPSDTIAPDAEIIAAAPHPWVSRGGVKLAHALDAFAIDPRGLVCLDLGASTGGFTDVLLARGAARVHAVDVGHGQLHPKIAADPRVVSHEGVDAREVTLERLGAPPALIVIDVAFIALTLVLPAATSVAGPGTRLAALIKPQFEAGRERVKKGVVREPAIHAEVCDKVADAARALGWTVEGVIPSPIEGGDGNREFLMAAQFLAHT
ncbi:TlyA family RNA methyltransferase [Blastochloris tepida]|uniref:TlyA family rRNA (Cytidine-2'-O)-methyltransferase n=1 Tax=Blastochloris tepida TaxID=2233851 RepID=A0A348G2H4_9HYPH|nr:TlyA family RNA methyltransferase [Blastochloris tepida]BBF93757.1 TlyA family rRNA (cytidine-2'-O)-methyltransferase [Blastochloris tepida]